MVIMFLKKNYGNLKEKKKRMISKLSKIILIVALLFSKTIIFSHDDVIDEIQDSILDCSDQDINLELRKISYTSSHEERPMYTSGKVNVIPIPVPVSYGGIGTTSLSANKLLVSGTTSTNSVTSLSAGVAGQMLISSGSEALPVWVDPNSKKLFINLTSDQIKHLRSQPIVLIPAPGTGKAIEVFRGFLRFVYGGNNPFVANSGQSLRLSYKAIGGESIMSIVTNDVLTSTVNKIGSLFNAGQAFTQESEIVNQPLILFNDSVVEIGGNAANDNVIQLVIIYQIVSL